MTQRLKAILKGAASVLDIWPDSRDRLERVYPYRSEADALRSDWERIGADMWKAIQKETQAAASRNLRPGRRLRPWRMP